MRATCDDWAPRPGAPGIRSSSLPLSRPRSEASARPRRFGLASVKLDSCSRRRTLQDFRRLPSAAVAGRSSRCSPRCWTAPFADTGVDRAAATILPGHPTAGPGLGSVGRRAVPRTARCRRTAPARRSRAACRVCHVGRDWHRASSASPSSNVRTLRWVVRPRMASGRVCTDPLVPPGRPGGGRAHGWFPAARYRHTLPRRRRAGAAVEAGSPARAAIEVGAPPAGVCSPHRCCRAGADRRRLGSAARRTPRLRAVPAGPLSRCCSARRGPPAASGSHGARVHPAGPVGLL